MISFGSGLLFLECRLPWNNCDDTLAGGIVWWNHERWQLRVSSRCCSEKLTLLNGCRQPNSPHCNAWSQGEATCDFRIVGLASILGKQLSSLPLFFYYLGLCDRTLGGQVRARLTAAIATFHLSGRIPAHQ